MFSKSHKHLSRCIFASINIAALLLSSQFTAAQALEEVVVTARKRTESLQDVPISVQALSGERIAVQGIVDLQQLAPYTPNFSYSTAPGASDLFFMRGLGTYGSGIHFEPSVGQVFNGFFSTRSRLGRSALIDVAQVEVLKGPQGAIIGKNTSLGALNITSNKPTEEFEAGLSTQYNVDASEGYEVEGFVSGPLSDRLRGRAVINYRDVDGWIKNTVTGDDLQKKKDFTGRVILDFDVTDNITAEVLYQRTDFNRDGKGSVTAGCLSYAPPAGPPHSVARASALGFDCNGLDAQNSTVDVRRETPGGATFPSGEPFDLESDMVGLTLTAEYENFVVTSLTSWTGYEITDFFSGDQLSVERVAINNAEDFSQIYQELRINGSASSGLFDYIAGVTYFHGELDAVQSFHAIAGAIGRPTGPALSRNELQQSETESLAAFGQIDWHVNDQVTLIGGLRVTDEDREGAKAQVAGEIYTSILNPALCALAATGVPLAACTNGDGSPVTGQISKTNVSYNVALQYAMNDDHKFYFAHATGFKSGGFDLRGAGNPASFIFDEEESTNYEIGGRHTFFEDTLRFNWTIFHTEVDNLQVSANDPVLIQQIVAAADATSEGVEFNLLWAASDSLTLSIDGAYTDATYDSFSGSCYLTQVENGTGCTNVTISGGQRSGVQVLDGERLTFAPEWSFVAGADYTMPLGNMELTASAKYIYSGSQFTSIERDPFGFQRATGRIDASLVLSGAFEGGYDWSLALVGRNLTDELVNAFVNSSTLSGSAAVSTSLEETRAIALRASISF